MQPLSRVDATLGDAVERAVRFKHARRLKRLGWGHAVAPPPGELWARGDPPPREGCSFELLVDGAEGFPAIAEAIRGARSYVHLTGWHLAPSFEVERGQPATTIGGLLAEVAERDGVDVRLLVWAGAPVPAFHPTRGEVEEAVSTLVRETQIHCERDPREHPFHCHHEKTVIVDGEVAFVGGLDLTDQDGDRFDSSDHPARRRLGWHDAVVRLHGPVVADVDRHFRQRWHEVTHEDLGPPPAGAAGAGSSRVQVVRTVAEDMYQSVPKGDFRILESYVRALSCAERYVYLENQFLWAPELVDLLAAKLREPPHPDFRVVVMLPSKANNGQDDTKGQLGVLLDADDDAADGGGRLLAATIRGRTGTRTDPIYLHAKIGIVDDRWLTVGSANLNAHSLMNDTELNVVTDDRDVVRGARVRLWSEHLELEAAEVEALDPCEVVDRHWRPIAEEQLERRRSGAPATHRLIELPGVSKRSGRLLGPLQGLVDDG